MAAQGAALITSVLLLFMMTIVAMMSMDIVEHDQVAAGYGSRARLAFYAAEAGLSEALSELEKTGTPSVTDDTKLGNSTIYPKGQPSYKADPNATDPMEYIGLGTFEGMNMSIGAGGSSKYQLKFWTMRVQGEAPGGVKSRVEMAAGIFVAN